MGISDFILHYTCKLTQNAEIIRLYTSNLSDVPSYPLCSHLGWIVQTPKKVNIRAAVWWVHERDEVSLTTNSCLSAFLYPSPNQVKNWLLKITPSSFVNVDKNLLLCRTNSIEVWLESCLTPSLQSYLCCKLDFQSQ